MDESQQAILKLIDRLVEARPLTALATGKLLEVPLVPIGDRSTEYSLIYGAADGRLFARAELRLPGPAGEGPRQLLDVQLRRGTCITMEQIQKRYGPAALSVPNPRQPPEAPLYLRYDRDWGALSFGFARPAGDCLTSFVIDVPPGKARKTAGP